MDSQNRQHLDHDGKGCEPSEPSRNVVALAPETTQPGAPRQGRTPANPLFAGKSLQVHQRTGVQVVTDLPGCPRHASPFLLQVDVNRKSAPRTPTAECTAVIARATTAPHPTTSSCNRTSAAEVNSRRRAEKRQVYLRSSPKVSSTLRHPRRFTFLPPHLRALLSVLENTPSQCVGRA